MIDIADVPCRSCQLGYAGRHACDIEDYCPCDRRHLHSAWWRVVLPYAVFGVEVNAGEVVSAAPIGRWMVGKRWDTCRNWVIGKKGTTEPL